MLEINNMSSITDKPISKKGEDLLKVEKYSKALSNFITRSDTPITIGLQGEWGTGKTSLMSLLLEDFNTMNIACSWVNTWEYSMFKGANETTPGVLRGMLEKLKEACQARGIWTLQDESQEKFKKAARFLGGLANQIIVSQIGINVKEATEGINRESTTNAEIAQIKALITSIINDLIDDPKNPVKKVVFFVDDLDRIPPGDAVEVLEALKNIFDIPNCVFILAIDYDVVVKGLESKFGPKTEENEREFRSFFDKIIQVPFSMPVGTYDIENFLVQKLSSLNITISDENKEIYTKTVKHTIGYNPRSLKRYLNSFSLINHLKELDEDEDTEDETYMLFAILGIQISYPKLFRLMTQLPDFTKWNKGFANKFGVEWESVKEKLEKYGDNDLIDEEWEQVCWGFCQTDTYLRSRAFSALELMNLLKVKYGENLENQIEKAMMFAAITSVDDDMATKQAVQKVGGKTIYNGIDTKILQLKEEGYSADAIENWTIFWAILSDKEQSNPKFRISFAKSGCSFNDDSKGNKKQIFYCDNPQKTNLGMKVNLKSNSGIVKKCYETYSVQYNLTELDSFFISKENDLILGPLLFEALGKDKYRNLLTDIAKEIN